MIKVIIFIMATKNLLCDVWGIWLSYFLNEEEQKIADYNDTIRKEHRLITHLDLIAFWTLSPLSDLRNFFVHEKSQGKNTWNSYRIQKKPRQFSAINYFKDGITPTWQDPRNSTGGRFIFQIDRQHENHEQIYEWLVFYFIGGNYENSEQINGIRFISSKFMAPFKFHYRVEIWVSFNEQDIDRVERFRNMFIKEFHNKFQIKNFKPYFKDNK